MKKLLLVFSLLLILNSCQSIKISGVATINQKRFPVISADEYAANQHKGHMIIAWQQNRLYADVRLQTRKRPKGTRVMAGGIPKVLRKTTRKNDIIFFILYKDLLDHQYTRNIFRNMENMERRFYIVYNMNPKTADR